MSTRKSDMPDSRIDMKALANIAPVEEVQIGQLFSY